MLSRTRSDSPSSPSQPVLLKEPAPIICHVSHPTTSLGSQGDGSPAAARRPLFLVPIPCAVCARASVIAL